MTVLEASAHLYSWFSENESFNLNKDFMKIIAITEHPERDKAAFLCSLRDLERGELISSNQDLEEEYWILKKPFNSYPQTVAISPDLCLAVSDIINNFCENIGDHTNKCDPTKVEEDDIKNLIYIVNLLGGEKKDLDSNGELD